MVCCCKILYIYMYIYPAEVRERKLTETVIQELWWDIVLQNTYVLWSPYFSKIIYTQYIFEKKKPLYLIKMITAFSFFKLSYPEGQLGWVLSLPPMQLQLPSLSPPSLSVCLSLSSSLLPSVFPPHSTVAQWTAPTAISHHYHLPSWASASHYHAALLIFLSYQLANHKPLSLMAQFGVRRYSFCRST